MADEVEDLRAKLAQLRARLEGEPQLPAETRALLDQVLADIERLPRGERADATLSRRLSEAALEFEGKHPTLSGAVGSVIDALSRMGI
ncbi:MAG TPA: DUF4404 family protein [Pirellulales bacterium]|jgi:hypothetical protein|nr:DUF4404 family protein [Pirellulales bacterium]